MSLSRWGLLLGLLCWQMTGWAAQKVSAERLVVQSFSAMEQGDLSLAEQLVGQLLKQYPHYQLAHLLKADLLMFKAGQWQQVLALHQQPKVQSLIEEAKSRWQAQQQQQVGEQLLKRYLVKWGERTPYWILVDLSRNRLYLFRQHAQQPEKVTDVYITLGKQGFGKQTKGDGRTPIGSYLIEKWYPESTLPPLYGAGALTLNYPNGWDQLQGRSGSGIWLHGTPEKTYVRAPQDSKGCVVLSNPDMKLLIQKWRLPQATPVLLVTESSIQKAQDFDWKGFKQAWMRHSWVVFRRHGIGARWQDVNVMAYPNEAGLYFVSYPIQKGKNDWAVVQEFWRWEQEKWHLVKSVPPQKMSPPNAPLPPSNLWHDRKTALP